MIGTVLGGIPIAIIGLFISFIDRTDIAVAVPAWSHDTSVPALPSGAA